MKVAVVAIGRNEGARLDACLRSAIRDAPCVIYVDSGSSDDSVQMAQNIGADVVRLDMSRPFSAARGRNAGFQRLRELPIGQEIEYVQFIDGDCELAEGWLQTGCETLDRDPKLAAACGRRREKFPDASVFNRICDIEWDTSIGETRACGGDAIYRITAFEEVGGFDDGVIAAEDDEVCVRLRKNGWRLKRIDAEMTMHDANMHSASQWWKRAVRAGHGFAQGFAMHGEYPERHFFKPLRGVLFWSCLLPVACVALATVTSGISLILALFGYISLWLKTTKSGLSRGMPGKWAAIYATNCVLAKFPESVGVWKYCWSRMRNRSTRIIEYK
tara:strand:- start:91568 stop:92557 length:990 start_codon:yes stop_codon:yes gene_type:complete